MEKGCGSGSAPFFFYISIISISATGPDSFPDFIFFTESWACGEKRQNRGLTEFFGNRFSLAASGDRKSPK
jgi:hypothetical protein